MEIPQYGGTDIFERIDKKMPLPKKGEVRILVKASGINFADILARKGLYPDAPSLPMVVGYEVSGIIDAIGESVPEQFLGKEVIALTRFKGYASHLIVSSEQIFEKPASLSFEEAAALPVTYITGWQLLVVMGGLSKGESVLIHNAGGGVGLAAIDIAHHIGAKIYGTASPRKHDFLKKRGITPIDYTKNDWLNELLVLTENKGVELVIDPIGGKNLKKSFEALRATGRLGTFGVSTLTDTKRSGKIRMLKVFFQMPRYNPLTFLTQNKGVFGVNVGKLWNEQEKVNSWFKEILKGVREGWVKPHVDMVFPLTKVGLAHQYIEERRNIGKVILVPEKE